MVSIPERVLEALKLTWLATPTEIPIGRFQSLKGF